MRAGGIVVVACLIACGEMIPAPVDDAGDAGDGGGTDATTIADASGGDGGSAPDAADAGCPAESCASHTSCTSLGFATTTCAPWTLEGNVATTTHECSNGKLKLAGAGTDDITVETTLPTPTSDYEIHIAARIAIDDWDGGRVLLVEVEGATVVQVRGDDLGGGIMQLTLCRASLVECATTKVSFPAGSEHLVVIDIGESVARMTVDCLPGGEVEPAQELTTNNELKIEIGKPDADPIEGTFGDVVVWFTAS